MFPLPSINAALLRIILGDHLFVSVNHETKRRDRQQDRAEVPDSLPGPDGTRKSSNRSPAGPNARSVVGNGFRAWPWSHFGHEAGAKTRQGGWLQGAAGRRRAPDSCQHPASACQPNHAKPFPGFGWASIRSTCNKSMRNQDGI